MLGRLQMTTGEALKSYCSLAGSIFSKKNKKPFIKDGAFKATTLETAIQELVSERDLGDRMLWQAEHQDKGLAFVCAMPAQNMAHPRCFRSYSVRENTSPNCLIWEAARATTAAPTFFKSIAIGEEDRVKELFIDGRLRCNNPSNQVLDEADALFGDDSTLGCLLSLGTGHKGTIGLSEPDSFERILPTGAREVLKEIVTDCEETAHALSRRFRDIPSCFFRFSVSHGLGDVSLEEWEKLGEVTSHTMAYLRETNVTDSINKVVTILTGATGPSNSCITLRSVGP